MTRSDRSMPRVQALVIGSGISGLFTALKLAEQGIQTMILTKAGLSDNNSRYAQGGIATVLPQNAGDSIDLHVKDTIQAGAGLTSETAVRSILAEGYPAIEDLLHYGVPFDRTSDNQLAVTKEAAHSVSRIIHAGGDATGASVEQTLSDRVKAHPNIRLMEHSHVVELLTKNNRCFGCRVVDLSAQCEVLIEADFTVLATGGIGRLYSHTTNPPIATGDGVALAHKAAAKLQHLEFIQFHPTAFFAGGRLQFLISEALRGEGGILKNHNGDLFAKKYHPAGELAPRDIVTRAIYAEMRLSNTEHVFLDITHLPTALVETRFPNILENCLRFGVDIRRDLIPVAPAAHYMMGGVSVDYETGATSVDHLYGVGETVFTGLHGANRLASNSLLECVVLARRVAREIGRRFEAGAVESGLVATFNAKQYRFETDDTIALRLQQLHELMWERVGILRAESCLTVAIQQIEAMQKEARDRQWSALAPEGLEYVSQLRVAKLVAQAAFNRRESLGAHYRVDSPVKQVQSQIFESLVLTP